MAQQRVTVTILQVSRTVAGRDAMDHIAEDGRLFHLPGADYDQTITALRRAGFEVADTLGDALDQQAGHYDMPTPDTDATPV